MKKTLLSVTVNLVIAIALVASMVYLASVAWQKPAEAGPSVVAETASIADLDEVKLDAETMNALADYMDPEIMGEISERLGSATPQEYIRAYAEADPQFAQTMADEFGIGVR